MVQMLSSSSREVGASCWLCCPGTSEMLPGNCQDFPARKCLISAIIFCHILLTFLSDLLSLYCLTLLVVNCCCWLIMLSAVSWTQQLPNMKPSIHMPRCWPSVFRHSQTNMQVPCRGESARILHTTHSPESRTPHRGAGRFCIHLKWLKMIWNRSDSVSNIHH